MQETTIIAPDDMHCHLRDGALLDSVILDTALSYSRAIVMPNLAKPILDGEMADHYREMILSALNQQIKTNKHLNDDSIKFAKAFNPLMTVYLTDKADSLAYKQAFLAKKIVAAKLYPAHATTNSAHGVTDIAGLDGVFRTMSEMGMPLLIHGEVTDPNIDIFDREAVFIQTILIPLRKKFPELKIVLEHITTGEAAEFVLKGDDNLAATVTPHHLLINRNALFQGGLRPHHYCLPILKREEHRQAVLNAAISGHPRFFAGTDSAPHTVKAKQQDCGCAGIYNSFQSAGLYRQIFEEAGGLDYYESFMSKNGAEFYGLPLNKTMIRLKKEAINVPESIEIANGEKIIPFLAGKSIAWQVASYL